MLLDLHHILLILNKERRDGHMKDIATDVIK